MKTSTHTMCFQAQETQSKLLTQIKQGHENQSLKHVKYLGTSLCLEEDELVGVVMTTKLSCTNYLGKDTIWKTLEITRNVVEIL